MAKIPENSIDLVVTSPPYWVEMPYEKGQPFEYFCGLMKSAFLEWKRIIKPGGYVLVNFCDVFNTNGRLYKSDVPSTFPMSLKYFEWGVSVAEFDLQATRIWRKKFAKMGIPFVCNHHPRPIFDYEHIWSFRKKNGSKKEVVHDRKLSQRGVVGEDWSGSAKLSKFCASFPIELPRWGIQVYSNIGDVVLDPFMGAGTTGVAAISLSRDFTGFEKDKSTYEIAENNINGVTNVFA